MYKLTRENDGFTYRGRMCSLVEIGKPFIIYGSITSGEGWQTTAVQSIEPRVDSNVIIFNTLNSTYELIDLDD